MWCLSSFKKHREGTNFAPSFDAQRLNSFQLHESSVPEPRWGSASRPHYRQALCSRNVLEFSHLSNPTYTTESSTCWLNLAIIHLSITYSLIIRTSVKVSYNTYFPFKIFTTQTTAKLFVVRMYQLMRFQILYCTKTLCTLTTYIKLHTFMSK